MNQFIETRSMFENTLCVDFPLSYEGWLAVRDDLKAAALYVQFYNQITLAWKFAKSDFTSDEDGISTVMQYLIKNVPIIKADSKKYTERYMYRVAYNCMGCLRRVQRESDRYNLTTSNYAVNSEGIELDLFSTMIGEDADILDTLLNNACENEFYMIVETLDDDSKRVIESLLGGRVLGKRLKSKQNEIIEVLKTKFDGFRNTYYHSEADDDTLRFERVLEIDDKVASAVVVMTDDTKAVYYGETRVSPNGAVKVVFFGDKQDYVIPVQIANSLKVLDVELY